MKWLALILAFCLLANCVPTANVLMSVPEGPSNAAPSLALRPSVTPYPTPTRAPIWTPGVSAMAPGLLATPDQFVNYFTDSLRGRYFGNGNVKNMGVMGSNVGFVRYRFSSRAMVLTL